ncbi:hypothetical protein [Streptomyces uncialis]|uniref:hypothetical protein n=1 Tax=Streptomyces uncialis TaxID=1048205 RepID=UPI0033F19173
MNSLTSRWAAASPEPRAGAAPATPASLERASSSRAGWVGDPEPFHEDEEEYEVGRW